MANISFTTCVYSLYIIILNLPIFESNLYGYYNNNITFIEKMYLLVSIVLVKKRVRNLDDHGRYLLIHYSHIILRIIL